MKTKITNLRLTDQEVKIILNTDAKTASKITGKSIDVIYTYRSKLGIGRVSKYRRWTKEQDVMLGTMSDLQLAKIIKRSPSKVQRRRARLGVEPFNQPNPTYTDWSDQEKIALLLAINQVGRPRYGKRLQGGKLYWEAVAEMVPGRTPKACARRYQLLKEKIAQP